jgi:hypothetical protein
VDHRIRHRNPYPAVCYIAEWAADHWDELDATLALTSGLDPMDLPFRRVINIAKRLLLEQYEPEARERLGLILDWPEVRAEQDAKRTAAEAANREQAQTMGSEQLVGSFGTSMEQMYERALRARTLAQAQITERQRQDAAKEDRIRAAEAQVLHTDDVDREEG